MNSLKNKITEILRVNNIVFSLEYHHKGHFIDIKGADDIVTELESWIGYDVLNEYLIGRDIYYNFSGAFILQNDKIMISISFSGPYEGEFEAVELPVDQIFSEESVKKDLENVISAEIDFSELYVQFGYDESEGCKYLDVNYFNETSGNWIELTQTLSVESMTHLKEFIKDYIPSNVPSLNLPKEIEQEYYAECEENKIQYYISSSDLTIEWDAVEN
jgi:hypothetical protein